MKKVVTEVERTLEGKIALKGMIVLCDTKDVDLEKEIETYMHIHNLYVQDGGRIVFKHNGEAPNYQCDFRDIAKYFYKLGLAQKGE